MRHGHRKEQERIGRKAQRGEQHRRRYPVVKNGKLAGQISRRDVLRAAWDFMKNKQS